jgi:hypothetical protein
MNKTYGIKSVRKSLLSLAVVFFALFPGLVTAQEFSFPELQGYKKYLNYPVYTRNNLSDAIPGAADIYLSYGFVDLNIAEYKKGKNMIRIEIYRQSDPVMAFGIYSSERSPSSRFLNLGTQGYNSDGAINFLKGNYYVRIRAISMSEKNLQSAESLAQRIAIMLPGNPEMPAALLRFPETGKKSNEERYINENVLGHKFLSGAFKAVYEVGPDIFSLYIIETKTPADTWKTAEAYLRNSGEDVPETDNGKYVISDRYNGTVFLAWADKTIVIITGLSKDQSEIAEQYTSEIIR